MSKRSETIFSIIFFLFVFIANILFLVKPGVFQHWYPFLMSPNVRAIEGTVNQKQALNIEKMLATGNNFHSQYFSSLDINMSETEKNHMNDVEQLLIGTKEMLLLLCCLLAAVFIFQYKMMNPTVLQEVMKNSFIVYSVTSLLSAGLITFAWSSLFTQFHELLFPQGNWSFPLDSTLIRLFPEVFWQRTFLLIAFLPVFEYLLLFILCGLVKQKWKNARIGL